MPQIKPVVRSGTDTGVMEDEISAHAIYVEQIKALYKSLPPILAINFIVASLVIYGLWNVVPRAELRLWAVAMLVVILARVMLYLFYRRAEKQALIQAYARYFVVGSGATGLAWGVAGVLLFPPETLEYQLFILFVLVGMGAGAVTSLTAFMAAFYAYLLPSLLPVCVMMLMISDPIHTALGMMTLAYIVALSFFAHNINHSFVQSLMLRFENIHLVKELSQQKEQAEQANIAKSKFLAAASHDLRQPLHAMSLQIGQLKASLQDEQAERILAQISNSQFALSDILNALLDISHLDAGTLKPNFTHFPLAQLFTRLENEFGPQTRERGVELRLRSTRAWLYSDAALLYRVLANLVDNAIKHTRAPGVLIAARQRGDNWRIEVCDCGPGIPAEQQQAIFDEFVQLDNPGRDRRKGLGLGLSIVQRLNQLLGHQLSLISRSGYGSCFRLEVAEGTPMPRQNGEPLSHEERGYRLQGAVVLVVDDDPDVLTATRDLLTGWKCAVVTAASLEEAVAVAADEEIDMIIADYRLADGRTGLEVIEALNKKGGRQSKAVIITGDVNAEELNRLRDGHYPVLSKPVMPVTLRSTLHQLMVD
jgi:signal transduction histidine kinase